MTCATKGRRKGWTTRGGVLAAVGVVLAGASLPAGAAEGPSLGDARDFAVLGHETVTNTDTATVVTGHLGVWPGSAIDGFPPGIVTQGEIHANDARAERAQRDAGLAYAYLAGMASDTNLTSTDLGGLTLAPGVYTFNTSALLTGALVLDAGGNSGAVFVFQIGSSLTTGTGASVTVINGGADYDESKIFWQVGSSATINPGTAFLGNVLAYASVSMNSGASLLGRALAINGAVTLDFNAVTVPAGSANGGNARPSKGRTRLLPPEAAPLPRAFALLDVKHFPENRGRDARSWLRIKPRHLAPATDYTFWMDDPSTEPTDLVQFDAFTTTNGGSFNYMLDTKRGAVLPFDASLASLSGMVIEVRDAAGTTTLLAGTIPTMTP
jgi:hypothetical protein